MKTDLNHARIAMIIEQAGNERGFAVGRFIATAIHGLLDRLEKNTEDAPQAGPVKPTGYHLNSEGNRASGFDTSAFV
ncbi:MAG: hypothetical protein IAE88_05690 [Rhodobacteraceae bacterium]|nr:hypothetical protein [Paracoccaceae bacterium]